MRAKFLAGPQGLILQHDLRGLVWLQPAGFEPSNTISNLWSFFATFTPARERNTTVPTILLKVLHVLSLISDSIYFYILQNIPELCTSIQ